MHYLANHLFHYNILPFVTLLNLHKPKSSHCYTSHQSPSQEFFISAFYSLYEPFSLSIPYPLPSNDLPLSIAHPHFGSPNSYSLTLLNYLSPPHHATWYIINSRLRIYYPFFTHNPSSFHLTFHLSLIYPYSSLIISPPFTSPPII